MPLIGSVADDLTGGTTTAVLLARSKARTAVFFNENAAATADRADGLDAIVISSNSRPLPRYLAYKAVTNATRALKSMGVRYFQKRIDTTLRGDIGVEIDAMLDQMDDGVIAVVVPAMPQSRRILVGGYSVIDGVALVNTPVAQDVRTPVLENYIPRLLARQSSRPVGFIPLDVVLDGAQSISEGLRDQQNLGKKIIVVDAITLEDVEAIAQACVDLELDVLSVDPGPFTAKLAHRRGLIQEESPNIPSERPDEYRKTVLIAAGSATPVTKRQMEVLTQDPRHQRIAIDPLPMVDGGNASMDECFKAINKAVSLIQSDEQPRAILFETALHGELLDLDEEDAKRSYPSGESADRINAALGFIISEVMNQVGRDAVAGLYTTGGDTMVSVCQALGVECLEVLDYVIPQADVGRLVGNYAGLPVVGKGGLTGTDQTACEIVSRLFKEAARK